MLNVQTTYLYKKRKVYKSLYKCLSISRKLIRHAHYFENSNGKATRKSRSLNVMNRRLRSAHNLEIIIAGGEAINFPLRDDRSRCQAGAAEAPGSRHKPPRPRIEVAAVGCSLPSSNDPLCGPRLGS